ncbi:10563_t:CDS:1, partial [Dentiscutata heterogama]
YDRMRSKERFCYFNDTDDIWDEIKKELEGHVELVLYESILVNLIG